MSESLREPQLTPADHVYVILQDHGPADGGWGPAAVLAPPIVNSPQLWFYTGTSPVVINWAKDACRMLAQHTGKPTMLARYEQREDVFVVGGAS
jgi:hypothetical protein